MPHDRPAQIRARGSFLGRLRLTADAVIAALGMDAAHAAVSYVLPSKWFRAGLPLILSVAAMPIALGSVLIAAVVSHGGDVSATMTAVQELLGHSSIVDDDALRPSRSPSGPRNRQTSGWLGHRMDRAVEERS